MRVGDPDPEEHAVARVSKDKAPVLEALEHDPEKWAPVFRKRSCSNKKIERDDDSKKSHHALAGKSFRQHFFQDLPADILVGEGVTAHHQPSSFIFAVAATKRS